METPVQRWSRLVNALEDLVAEEAAALHGGDFDAANTIGDRAAMVVEWLVTHASVITPPLAERLASVQAKRAANAEFLEGEITRTRDNLQQVAIGRRRVAQIAPVYGRSAGTAQRSRLSAVG
jgi:hypothetical protein